jgi:hypothetical protein
MSLQLVRPKTIESLLIEAKRKLDLEATDNAETQVEILIGTELFLDLCQRIVVLETQSEKSQA